MKFKTGHGAGLAQGSAPDDSNHARQTFGPANSVQCPVKVHARL